MESVEPETGGPLKCFGLRWLPAHILIRHDLVNLVYDDERDSPRVEHPQSVNTVRFGTLIAFAKLG